MRTIFIADAHLNAPSDTNYQLLLQFLDQLCGTVDTLVIVGDLFDFWVGLPGMPSPEYRPVIDSLKRLTESGARPVYFEGNHDFQLGRVFRDDLRAEVHEGPAILELQGQRILVCHGDQINPHDHGYRRLRSLLRSLPVRLLISICPAPLALAVKARLQRHSRSRYGIKQERWNYREIIMNFSHQQHHSGIRGMVCGHFHLPFIEQHQSPPFTTLSLGDWITGFSYGEMTAGQLSLHSYRPS